AARVPGKRPVHGSAAGAGPARTAAPAVRRPPADPRRPATQAGHHHGPAAAAPFPQRRPAGDRRMTSATADPYGAQAHARAMAGTRILTMPTLPASEAADRPEGVPAEAMIWSEVIAAGGYTGKRIGRGARLRLTDLEGDACASMLLFNAEQPLERLNVA